MEHYNPLLTGLESPEKFITVGEIMLRLTPPNYEKIRMTSTFEASYGGSEAKYRPGSGQPGRGQYLFLRGSQQQPGKSAIRMLRSNDVHCTPVNLKHAGADTYPPAGKLLPGNRIRDPRQ